jgi:hypothetical protein
MNRKPIAIETFTIQPQNLFDGQWMLLTSGDSPPATSTE